MRTHNTDLISSYIEALNYSGAVNPFNYKITSEVMMKLYQAHNNSRKVYYVTIYMELIQQYNMSHSSIQGDGMPS